MNVVQFSVEPLLRVAQAFAATPMIMAELGRLLRDPNANLEQITTHVKRDSALAARLLRVANSAYFAQREKVASIEEAAAFIGFQEIHRVIGAMAIDQFSQSNFPLYGFAGRRLRENALFVALLMEELAGSSEEDPQTAYTIGLLRSIGKVALEKLGSESKGAKPFDAASDADLTMWEKSTFGITSNEATALILQQWHFPTEISQAIAEHFAPSTRPHPLAHLLNLSANMAEKFGYGLPGEQRYWLETEEVYCQSGVDPRNSKRHIERAVVAFERVSRTIA